MIVTIPKLNSKDMYEEGHNDELKVGDRVNHNKFGDGVVVKVDKSLVTIAFGFRDGIKEFAKSFKGIKKI